MKISLLSCSIAAVVSILLIVAAARIEKAISNMPATSDAQRANKGVYTIGVILLAISVTLAALNAEKDVESKYVNAMIGALGVVLLTLAAVIINKTSGDARKWASLVLVSGILMIVGAAVHVFYKNQDGIRGLFEMYGDSDGDDESDSEGSEFKFSCY